MTCVPSTTLVTVSGSACPRRRRPTRSWATTACRSEILRLWCEWREESPRCSASISSPTSTLDCFAPVATPRPGAQRRHLDPGGRQRRRVPIPAGRARGAGVPKGLGGDGGGLSCRTAEFRESGTLSPGEPAGRAAPLQRLPGGDPRPASSRAADRRHGAARHGEDPTGRERGDERVARRGDGTRRVDEQRRRGGGRGPRQCRRSSRDASSHGEPHRTRGACGPGCRGPRHGFESRGIESRRDPSRRHQGGARRAVAGD